MRRILVTGGVRSGKSRHAESLLRADVPVTYVATGPTTSEETDPAWRERVAAHRASRPTAWRTIETRDPAGALTAASGPVLVDCLGTWLTACVDELGAWEWSGERVAADLEPRFDDLVLAVADAGHDVVLVTNEVGWGVVPSHRSGLLFRDLLGRLNQNVASACDEVHLVVAGRVLRL